MKGFRKQESPVLAGGGGGYPGRVLAGGGGNPGRVLAGGGAGVPQSCHCWGGGGTRDRGMPIWDWGTPPTWSWVPPAWDWGTP